MGIFLSEIGKKLNLF